MDENLFYEIPVEALDSDLLWVVQTSETTAGNSYAGMPVTDRVVRWELRNINVRYILRWRLEKKNPESAISEPIKPTVWYVAREVPQKWKNYVKAGIEDWAPAFAAAGFTNAIIGKYAPDPREDPDWDVEDARISSIRWLPSDIENAFGAQVHDPRTGEILSADVRMYHNVQKLVRDWYFVQASPNDARAQTLPLPDELEGELIRFVVAPEVGYSLGFPNNMKASSSYTIPGVDSTQQTEDLGSNAAYTPTKLFGDLREGIFRELAVAPADIDLYRRNLQRAYVELLSSYLKASAVNSDLPAYARSELEAIRELIRKTDVSRSRSVVQIHLEELQVRIQQVLDPRAPLNP